MHPWLFVKSPQVDPEQLDSGSVKLSDFVDEIDLMALRAASGKDTIASLAAEETANGKRKGHVQVN